MANTYTLIASSTVGSGGASSIDFTSIPATYTDLKLVLSSRSDYAGQTYQQAYIKFNGSSVNYSNRYLLGTGASVTSQTVTTGIYLTAGEGATATANTFTNDEAYIPNYRASQYKSVSVDSVQENNATTAYALFDAGLWSDTSAITSISIFMAGGNFVQYSSAYLYGIKNS